MQITRNDGAGIVELALEGRLDGYWADHVDSVLADVVRDRGAAGAGESEFIRGACWVGPVAGLGKER